MVFNKSGLCELFSILPFNFVFDGLWAHDSSSDA